MIDNDENNINDLKKNLSDVDLSEKNYIKKTNAL